MKYNSALVTAIFAVSILAGGDVAAGEIPTTQGTAISTCGGEPCDAVIRGSFAFADRHLQGLKGNGRSCADCHMPQDQFQLSPGSVQARFKLLEWRRLWNPRADDPLLRPIDADDFRINGAQAQDFSNLRENGLIRIAMPRSRTTRRSACWTISLPSSACCSPTGACAISPMPSAPA